MVADDDLTVTLATDAGIPVPPTESTAGELEALLTNEIEPEAVPAACGVNVTVNGTLLPAAIVVGSEMPLRANSGLLRLTEDTVTLPPVALSVTERLVLVPTATFPKLRLVWFNANCPLVVPVPVAAPVPVPERGIVRISLDAVQAIARFPLAFPADCGVKLTLNVTLFPAARVTGRFSPLTRNSVPVTESEAVNGLSDASLVIAKLPTEFSVALGAKLMLKTRFWPIPTVTGGAGCTNGGRVSDCRSWLALETAGASVRAAVELLVAVAVKVLVVPTSTLPNLTASLGVVCCVVGAALMP